MSTEQRRRLDEVLRQGPLDLGGDLAEQRVVFEQMMPALPLPEDEAAEALDSGGRFIRSNL